MSERLKYEYVRYAIAYHVAASAAAECAASPVVGHLAHYAVEFYLKAFLSDYTSEEKRKNKLRHNLTKAWNALRDRALRAPPSGLDHIVKALDPFWDIRYPEQVERQGLLLSISRRGGESPSPPAALAPSAYSVSISDLDRLAKYVLEESRINPMAFRPLLAEGRRHWPVGTP